MLIESKPEFQNLLKNKTVLLTGAGGGIGFEAAKAFAYLGASVILAEIDEKEGREAERFLQDRFPETKIEFYPVDLSEERQVRQMHQELTAKYGFLDVLFHNAAFTPMGAVEEVPPETWEKSFRVNFQAPLRLTQLSLPQMKERDAGVIVFVPSSGAAPYMGAYEVFKTAQVELCNTLSGELEHTNIHTYSIGPGLVKTETAVREIKVVAERMGMTTEEFYAMNDSHILGAEEAGCGFAVSVLSAERYHGQEIGSIQALLDSGLLEASKEILPERDCGPVLPLIRNMLDVYEEQYAGWMKRNIFERQWVLRDFKKTVGLPAEQFKRELEQLAGAIRRQDLSEAAAYRGHFEKLRTYFQRQHKLLQGFEKDPVKLKENSDILLTWVRTLDEIVEGL